MFFCRIVIVNFFTGKDDWTIWTIFLGNVNIIKIFVCTIFYQRAFFEFSVVSFYPIINGLFIIIIIGFGDWKVAGISIQCHLGKSSIVIDAGGTGTPPCCIIIAIVHVAIALTFGILEAFLIFSFYFLIIKIVVFTYSCIIIARGKANKRAIIVRNFKGCCETRSNTRIQPITI